VKWFAAFSMVSIAGGTAYPATRPDYPRVVRDIPPPFRGAWDELVADGCLGREARFQLNAREFFNFEVPFEVLKVTLRSPKVIDVQTRLEPEFGGPEDDTWTFRLVKGGNALSAIDGKRPYYGFCRFRLNRNTGSFEKNRHR
jgi:hypothetical protein